MSNKNKNNSLRYKEKIVRIILVVLIIITTILMFYRMYVLTEKSNTTGQPIGQAIEKQLHNKPNIQELPNNLTRQLSQTTIIIDKIKVNPEQYNSDIIFKKTQTKVEAFSKAVGKQCDLYKINLRDISDDGYINIKIRCSNQKVETCPL